MICAPYSATPSPAGDAFSFSGGSGAFGRGFENVTVLWTAPWRAYWALTFEALDPENYRF